MLIKQDLAFVFPGQGSQSLGMLALLAKQFPTVVQNFEEASEVVDVNLWNVAQDGPESLLNQTHLTQPILLAASIAIWNIWIERSSFRPSLLAGHSLGEYSALVAAQVLSFSDAIRLVHARGQYMQQAVPEGEGAMAAILGLDLASVESACRDACLDRIVSPANLNAPGQIVIAGHRDAVTRAIAICKQLGAKRAIELPVSVPSHCALMKPAAEKLKALMNTMTFQKALFPVVHNVDVQVHTQQEHLIDALALQLSQPVQWVSTVEFFAQNGIRHVVECGSNKVLSGLCKRIDASLLSYATDTPDALSATLAAFKD